MAVPKRRTSSDQAQQAPRPRCAAAGELHHLPELQRAHAAASRLLPLRRVSRAGRCSTRRRRDPPSIARRPGRRRVRARPRHSCFPARDRSASAWASASRPSIAVARDTMAEADEAPRLPLSRLCFEGPGSRAHAHRVLPAGDPRGQRRSVAARSGRERRRTRVGSRATVSASTGARRRRARSRFRDARPPGAAARAAACRRPVPEGVGAMAAIVGLEDARWRSSARPRPATRSCEPGQLERRRPGRRGGAPRRRSRA